MNMKQKKKIRFIECCVWYDLLCVLVVNHVYGVVCNFQVDIISSVNVATQTSVQLESCRVYACVCVFVHR